MTAETAVLERSDGATAPASAVVVLKERLEIFPDRPLGEFDTPWATAYATRDLMGATDGLYALVLSDVSPAREDILPRLLGARSRGVFDLVDFGTVRWIDGRRRLVLACERPAAGALMPDLTVATRSMPFNELIPRVLEPVLEGLRSLSQLGIAHRGIRPSNLFLKQGNAREFALGDFLTGPPGAAQPPVFETIESAMSLPSGRGNGTVDNDIFSFGVTLLMLHLGRNPVGQMSELELMAARLQSGSFATLVGTLPISGSFRDLIRGMLQDAPQQRWGIEDLYSWVRERRGRVFVVGRAERALRPFALGGQNFYACRPLAVQLAAKWQSASLVEKKEELVNWLSRSIQEPAYLSAVARAFDWRWALVRRTFPGGLEAGLNARLCQALDRRAPVRYKSFAAFPDGLGTAFAAALGEPERIRDFSELLIQQLPEFALDLTATDDTQNEAAVQAFRAAAKALGDNRPGHGAERVLYELNPFYPCRSPIVAGERVGEIADLLPALERVAGNAPDGLPVDRHIAAFAAAHFASLPEEMFTLLAAPAGTTSHIFGIVGLIAALQAKFGPRSLPRLAHWLSPALRPAIESFHRRATRERLANMLPGVLDGGDFTRLQAFIVGGDLRRRDRDEFQAAVREYAKLETEVRFLESGGASGAEHSRSYGHMVAAWLSTAIGLIAAAFAVTMVL